MFIYQYKVSRKTLCFTVDGTITNLAGCYDVVLLSTELELRTTTRGEIPMVNRRNFLLGSAAAAAQAGVAAAVPISATSAQEATPAKRRPNIVVYHSDQFRWDFVGANGLNSSTRTPNIDALAAAGTNFNHAVTNQPVCGPSRSVMITGRYASETGVWHNGLGLKEELPTIATELRKIGYSANYIGKWHMAPGRNLPGGTRAR